MLKKIGNINFEVIFTTAYDQYAINAIRTSAPDYLLKPVDEEDLTAAIEKCKERMVEKKTKFQFEALFNNLSNKNPLDKTIALSGLDGVSFVKMCDILRVEANGRYAKFYLLNKETIVVSKTLGDFEESIISQPVLFVFMILLLSTLIMLKSTFVAMGAPCCFPITQNWMWQEEERKSLSN